ncbi:alpha/beta-hydrolase [Lojkania enalia]|uniref:Alpha/beta-hydrolase n=1 Tax=Lojkania enalia TaxID=147567 RepID=A0A9P4KFD4_9PLEO|nr:alpha/beta-hydrolase [Didymosphaeria enalia]
MACPDCFRGGAAVGDPVGEETTIHGTKTYVAGRPGGTTSQSTIIFYTDAFGLKLVNNKLLADAYASATGFRVLVPDIIPGGAMDPVILGMMDKVMEPVPLFNILGHLSRIKNLLHAATYFVPFFIHAWPSSEASFSPCLEYARKVKAELPPGSKLGVAGFCWGGYQAVNLCHQTAVDGGLEKLVDASFSAHPSGLDLPNDIVKAVITFKVPVSIAQAEKDFAVPTKKVQEAEAILRQKAGMGDGQDGFDYQITYYKDASHGFAVRAKPGSEIEAKGADDAKAQAIEWFKKWL